MGRLKYGTLTLTSLLSRSQFLEFGTKVLGLQANHLVNTPAFDMEFQEKVEDVDNLFKARVLAYATSTWQGYASAIAGFLRFCECRELSPFECTPSVLNLYLLKAAQEGKTVTFFENFLKAWSFVAKFFLCTDFTQHHSIAEIKKFAQKACTRKTNKKYPFGAPEVRKIWDKIDAEGGVEKLDFKRLRTFMMSVFQHRTFCRFSDLKNITLADVFHDADYFKIHVKFSKTDQQGNGQWLFLPKDNSGFRDAHMLMCLYVHHLDLNVDIPSPHVYLFPPLE
jgi:hypothetical protein